MPLEKMTREWDSADYRVPRVVPVPLLLRRQVRPHDERQPQLLPQMSRQCMRPKLRLQTRWRGRSRARATLIAKVPPDVERVPRLTAAFASPWDGLRPRVTGVLLPLTIQERGGRRRRPRTHAARRAQRMVARLLVHLRKLAAGADPRPATAREPLHVNLCMRVMPLPRGCGDARRLAKVGLPRTAAVLPARCYDSLPARPARADTALKGP